MHTVLMYCVVMISNTYSNRPYGTKSYSSSNASMDAGWNNSCHRVWILLRLYT